MKWLVAICLSVLVIACTGAPLGQPPSSPTSAPAPPAATAAAPAAPAADATVAALQKQNADLQATVTAQQSQGQVAAAQQTNTALQTAVAQPKPAEAKAPEPKPAAEKPTAVAAAPAPKPAPPPPTVAPPKPAAKSSGTGFGGIGQRKNLRVKENGVYLKRGPSDYAPEVGAALNQGDVLADAEATFGEPIDGVLTWWRASHPADSSLPRGFIHASQVEEVP
jgi:hypothetical protein